MPFLKQRWTTPISTPLATTMNVMILSASLLLTWLSSIEKETQEHSPYTLKLKQNIDKIINLLENTSVIETYPEVRFLRHVVENYAEMPALTKLFKSVLACMAVLNGVMIFFIWGRPIGVSLITISLGGLAIPAAFSESLTVLLFVDLLRITVFICDDNYIQSLKKSNEPNIRKTSIETH
ncbi:unnamed protein product [Didymodactylos carnosus]|uniref:Uncharacterized protein n=1 Tax=Didymodactylos carnosus TaxID=1234261 RepID=A0A814LES2_9BILA|nr:unnamed protein product [Didymodactylos carnosus]CAF3832584.1 unnamed protein product [Didymodactylos carnosus]